MSISGTSLASAQNIDASNAYSNAQKLAQSTSSGLGLDQDGLSESGTRQNAVASFSTVLNEAMQGAINTGKTAETQTAKALSGKGNMSDVVASVEEAKLTLQTVTTLRDRFVSAYQEVMRMSV